MKYIFAFKKLTVYSNVSQQGDCFQDSSLFCRVVSIGVCLESLGLSHCPVNASSVPPNALAQPKHLPYFQILLRGLPHLLFRSVAQCWLEWKGQQEQQKGDRSGKWRSKNNGQWEKKWCGKERGSSLTGNNVWLRMVLLIGVPQARGILWCPLSHPPNDPSGQIKHKLPGKISWMLLMIRSAKLWLSIWYLRFSRKFWCEAKKTTKIVFCLRRKELKTMVLGLRLMVPTGMGEDL